MQRVAAPNSQNAAKSTARSVGRFRSTAGGCGNSGNSSASNIVVKRTLNQLIANYILAINREKTNHLNNGFNSMRLNPVLGAAEPTARYIT